MFEVSLFIVFVVNKSDHQDQRTVFSDSERFWKNELTNRMNENSRERQILKLNEGVKFFTAAADTL